MTYNRYAAVYDGSGQIRFALLTGIYLEEILQRHPVDGRRALDLACGTGTLLAILAERGWEVTGLDASAAMLAQAAAKLAQASTRVELYQGDMRDVATLLPANTFDLVTCTYDSLNYLIGGNDLATCLRGIAQVLAPGGLFVGDMNTRHFLAVDWGHCLLSEQPGYVQVEQTHFDPVSDTSTMWLTGFIGNDHDGYERFDEIHIERAYPTEQVAMLINTAGLTIEGCYDGFTFQPPVATTQRIFWVARKPLCRNF
ncbi:class I SAM-dependent methyltransferase [Chloroflexus sp.]|uniref:class I SAM-dependent methyltransferase n=1 Tax=Chloroflexus sp. TaxID=1904827 RepID=UPI002639E8B5|nr:class I SAM-dependent methyltransferase [uncultured Chloroflexus sp.]